MNLLRLLSLVMDHLLTTALRQGLELPPRLDPFFINISLVYLPPLSLFLILIHRR